MKSCQNPGIAKIGLTARHIMMNMRLWHIYNDVYEDEDENDVNSEDTYLDRLRKFLLLMSLLFFIAFCGYLMCFLIRRDRTGRGKKRDDEHV